MSEFAKFNVPQIKRLQRLIYMSAVSPETTLQRYEIILNWHFIFYEGKNCEHKARDPRGRGFTKIKSEHRFAVLIFFIHIPQPESELSPWYVYKKSRTGVLLTFDFGSGGRIRTDDLRVMSPTSYHCSTPHSLKLKFENLKLKILSSLVSKSGAKVRTFPEMTKFFLFFICYCLIICLLKIPTSVFTRRV